MITGTVIHSQQPGAHLVSDKPALRAVPALIREGSVLMA
jgi:hypothetical protein